MNKFDWFYISKSLKTHDLWFPKCAKLDLLNYIFLNMVKKLLKHMIVTKLIHIISIFGYFMYWHPGTNKRQPLYISRLMSF